MLATADKDAVLEYSDRMDRKSLTGDDDSVTREEVLRKFRDHSSDVKTVFMSSVGDAAIDLPDASVIIQISSNFGSRMKEAQRLGRILRPKPNSTAEFNAHFYTLVSKDTQEMYYSTKRQRYLVDQGYAFKAPTPPASPRPLDAARAAVWCGRGASPLVGGRALSRGCGRW